MPWPTKRFVKFKYSWWGNYAPTLSAVSTNQFAANSCYDPDQTGVGNQPRYWDQLMGASLYNLYLVRSIDYTVRFNNNTANGALCMVSFRPNSSALPGNAGDMAYDKELPLTIVKSIQAEDGANNACIIKGSIPIHKILAISKLSYITDRTSYQGLYNGNPTALAYMNVIVSAEPQTATGADVDVYVDIAYNCEISENNLDVAQS
jgi:hypothetical protein